MSTEHQAKVEGGQLESAKGPIEWTGDLNDDCFAHWAGLSLRAEKMQRADWWWAVYEDRTREILGDSHEGGVRVTSGKKARMAAEEVARRWLERSEPLPDPPLSKV